MVSSCEQWRRLAEGRIAHFLASLLGPKNYGNAAAALKLFGFSIRRWLSADGRKNELQPKIAPKVAAAFKFCMIIGTWNWKTEESRRSKTFKEENRKILGKISRLALVFFAKSNQGFQLETRVRNSGQKLQTFCPCWFLSSRVQG